MRHVNDTVLSAVDTGSANGILIDANQLITASFQASFGDATAAGTFKIQASNDPTPAGNMALPGGFAPTNWTDIPSQTATIASGASALLTINYVSYRWLRAVFIYSSGGSSTITVNMEALSQ